MAVSGAEKSTRARASGQRSSSKNEAVQMERAPSSPTMSTVKSVTTLAIIFAFLIGIKHEVGCLRRTTEEFSSQELSYVRNQWAGGIARLTRSIASGGGAAFQLIEDAGTLRPPLSFPRGRGFSQGRLPGLFSLTPSIRRFLLVFKAVGAFNSPPGPRSPPSPDAFVDPPAGPGSRPLSSLGSAGFAPGVGLP